MEDNIFCIEYVSRIDISKGFASKTKRQMIEIVLQGKLTDISDMFNDKTINELYSTDNVGAFVYAFVRDNQELFCKPITKLKI